MRLPPSRVSRFDILLALALYLGLVAALVILPRQIPANTGIVSAAAAEGYNTVAAFWTAVCWAMLTVAVFTLRQRRSPSWNMPPIRSTDDERFSGSLDWRELLLVFALFALAYCPFFLARYGPYSEDVYFLAALGRMDCGQLPYRDFGFLYGPSMIYLLWGWSQLFGVSMTSYFGFLALLEGLQFAVLMGVLQRLVPQRGRRYLVFLVLLPFLFNNLLGLNYNGFRFLVPTLVVVVSAFRPHDRVVTLWCAVLLGLHLTYSHEYALAGLIAVLGMHAVMFVSGQRRASLQAGLVIALGSTATWLIVALLLLRGTMPSYIQHVSEVVRMMSSGHAGFRFYWTANSLALFGLLMTACVILGRRLVPGTGWPLDAGARLMLGSVLFALVALRSGLTRADLWHLNPGFLPLLFAFVLPVSVETIPGVFYRRIAWGLVLIAAVTFLIGIAPMGSLYAISYVRGFRDVLTATPRRSGLADGHQRGIELERTYPSEDLIALSRYFNSAERANGPVLFYGRTWDVPPRIGVCPAHYKLDDLMYTEFTRSEATFLGEHPDASVVMRTEDYRRLYGLAEPGTPHSSLFVTPAKQVARWLSTVHYDAAEIEARLQDETREQLTGRRIRSTYDLTGAFGEYVVLARRK